MAAAYNGRLAVTQALLRAEADMNLKNNVRLSICPRKLR